MSLNAFDASHAARYDAQWKPLAPFRDSLHLQMRLVLRDLPSDARILCVGVGTGAELLALARAFPHWQFIAVDPSAPMLEACRQNAAQAGILDRCQFHAAHIHEIPKDLACHAATSILVSQFLTDRAQRIDFFRQIARRLRPDGLLITADLCTFPSGQHESLYPIWQRMMQFAGATDEQVEAMTQSYSTHVSLLPPPQLENLLTEAGFAPPTLFSQTLLIHAWFSQRSEHH